MAEPSPLFVLKWDKDILAVTLVSILADIVLSSITQSYVPFGYTIYSIVLAFVVPIVLNWRGTLKVREIKFYDNSLKVSGLRFKMEYDYEDISGLELKKHGGFLSRDKIVFAIKYFEPRVFQSINPMNRELNTDLYTWLSIKSPASALQNQFKLIL